MKLLYLCITFLLWWKLNLVSPDSAFEVEMELDLSIDGGDEIGLKTSIYQEFDSDFYGDEPSYDAFEGQEELVFQPDNLVFMDCPVAIAETSSFQIFNHFGYDIHVTSVVSESNLIHPVMFQPQVIAPNESISLQILFLPYFQDNVVSQLIISTSQGDYEYQVKGFPVRNPYGLHPIVGIRIPAHAKFEQPIVVHNPHADTLHIKEVYTTEGFLTLRGVPLRSNHVSAGGVAADDEPTLFTPEIMWVIHPNHEREIITLSVPATLSPGFYQGYVHIKTDHDNMVVPVEMEVLEGAVYSAQQTVEFGTLTSVNEKRTLDLRLFNTGYEPILVSEIIPVTADPQLQINLVENAVLDPHSEEVIVATLTYTASSPGKILNKLLIVTNNSNAAVAVVEVMYAVTVLHGGVGFEHQKAIFVAPIRNTSDSQSSVSAAISNRSNDTTSTAVLIPRDFIFTNYFNALVSLQNVVVASCNDIFSSEGVLEEVVVDSFGKWPSIVVQFNETAVVELSTQYTDFLPKTCWLEVFTNISSHRIPIYIIDGGLELVFMDAEMIPPEDDEDGGVSRRNNADEYHIDLGSVSIEQPRLLRVALSNENPVRIPLELLNSTDGVCICTESSWPIGNNDEEAAVVHLAGVSQRNPSEDSRCACCNAQGQQSAVEANSEGGDAIAASPAASKAIGMAKSGYNTMFSISFHNLMDHFGTFEQSERNEVTVVLGSHYQQIILHLHFTMTKGKFVTLVVPGPQNFPKYTIGRHDVFRVVTILDFEEHPRDVTLATTSSVFAHKVDQVLEPGGLDKVKSFTTALYPANLCTHSALKRDSSSSNASGGYFSSLWSCTHEAIKASVFEQKFTKAMKVLRKLEDSAMAPSIQDPAVFHRDALRLKKMWVRSFPRGVPLATTEFVVQSAQALHRFPVQNASIQSPFPYMADSYKIKLPASRTNEIVWFYLSVSNPFGFPLEYAVHIPSFNGTADNVTNAEEHFIETISTKGVFDCSTVMKMLESDEEHQKLVKGAQKNSDVTAPEGEDACGVSFPTHLKIALFDDVRVHAHRTSATSSGSVSTRLTVNQEAASSNERFYVHSTSPRAWTVPPNGKLNIGPFFVNRHVRVTDPSLLNTLYVYNNFTGLEKVDVWTGVGNAKLVVSGLMTVLNTSHNEPESLLNKTLMSVSTENSEWMYDGVEVNRLNQVFYVHIVNEGQVNATVLNIDIDGVSCTSSSSGGGFFGGSTRSSLCSSIPVELAPGSEFTVTVRSPSSCFDPATIQRKVTLTLDKEISCFDSESSECHATTKTNELIATMYFHSSPSLEKQCLNKFPGRFFRSLLYFLLLAVFTVGGGILTFHILRRYLKWIRFCQAKRASSFQHSEILLHSSFAVTAPMLQMMNNLGFQFVLDAFIYDGGEFNKPSSQKRKVADASIGLGGSEGFGSESVSVPAAGVAGGTDGTNDRRSANTRNIDLRDVLLPDPSVDDEDQQLQISTSVSFVDRVLRSRNIKPRDKKISPSHHQSMRLQVPPSHKASPSITKVPTTPAATGPVSSTPSRSSMAVSAATTPPSVAKPKSPIVRTPSRDAQSSASVAAVAGESHLEAVMTTKQDVLKTPSRDDRQISADVSRNSSGKKAEKSESLDAAATAGPEVDTPEVTQLPTTEEFEEVETERPSFVDHNDDYPEEEEDDAIFEYHGELLNEVSTPSPVPSAYESRTTLPLTTAAAPGLTTPAKATGGSSWLTTPNSSGTTRSMPELLSAGGSAARQRSASPAFLSSFVEDDDDFDDLLRTDEFGDAFGAHPTLDFDSNIDFSMLQYATSAPAPVVPSQYSSLGGGYSSSAFPGVTHMQSSRPSPAASSNVNHPLTKTSASTTAAAPPPGLSLPNNRSLPSYSSPSHPPPAPSAYSQQQQYNQHAYSMHSQPSMQHHQQQHQPHHPSHGIMSSLGLDNDPDLAWVEDLTHDYMSEEDGGGGGGGYMPGGGSLFVSPVRTMGKSSNNSAPTSAATGVTTRVPEENQFWLQMNTRSKSNDEKDRNPFFGPNSFFDGKNSDGLESLEP